MFPDALKLGCSDLSRTPADALRELDLHAAAWWAELRSDSRFADLGRDALAAVPSAREVAIAPRPPLAWSTAADLILRAQSLGVEVLRA
jgi:hypothetical protein